MVIQNVAYIFEYETAFHQYDQRRTGIRSHIDALANLVNIDQFLNITANCNLDITNINRFHKVFIDDDGWEIINP
jgi:hypothetical protein